MKIQAAIEVPDEKKCNECSFIQTDDGYCFLFCKELEGVCVPNYLWKIVKEFTPCPECLDARKEAKDARMCNQVATMCWRECAKHNTCTRVDKTDVSPKNCEGYKQTNIAPEERKVFSIEQIASMTFEQYKRTRDRILGHKRKNHPHQKQ